MITFIFIYIYIYICICILKTRVYRKLLAAANNLWTCLPHTILDTGDIAVNRREKNPRLTRKWTEIYKIISAGAKYHVENKTR